MKEGTGDNTASEIGLTEDYKAEQESRRETSPVDSFTQWREIRNNQSAELEARAPDLRTTIWERYPVDYVPPPETKERVESLPEAPFTDPTRWAGDINPGGPRGPLGFAEDPRRMRNCADCARATERNWRGYGQVAAGLEPPGENRTRTEAWCGERFQEATFRNIGDRLTEAGDGASAIVAVRWHEGSGHVFNAVNYRGRVLAVDGQTGAVGAWPPEKGIFGFDESYISFSEAIVRDIKGKTT